MGPWLVTGGSGFLGRHVLDAAVAAGEQVVGLGRRVPAGWDASAFVRADLDDFKGLARAIAEVGPSTVIHAAGRTPPAGLDELDRGNARATVHLIDAIRATGRACRVVAAGSAAELGPVAEADLPVGESHPCGPVEPYGISKLAATATILAGRPPISGVVARLFNLIGPGMDPTQAFGRFARLLAAPGSGPIRLEVGDLDARRDFVDVRDAARAMVLLAARGESGRIYHVGNGRSRRVGEGLQHLIRRSGREVDVIEHRGAGSGPRDSIADPGALIRATGWAPRFAFEQSLDDLWDGVAAGRGCD